MVRNGVAVTLNVGDAVYQGDVVQTGTAARRSASSSATAPTFNLTANARMVLTSSSTIRRREQFLADQPRPGLDQVHRRRGGEDRRHEGRTPVATMGIRGTAVQVDIDVNNGPTKMSVLVEPGGRVGSFNTSR